MSTTDERKIKYDVIAHQINREDELVNKRLMWVLTPSGFLFSALGFLGGKNNPDAEILALFKIVLPLTGMALSTVGALGVLAAYIQIKYLTREWEKLGDQRWVRPFGDKAHSFTLGALPCILLPVILFIVWASLLFVWNKFRLIP